jgi:hypothetical protein
VTRQETRAKDAPISDERRADCVEKSLCDEGARRVHRSPGEVVVRIMATASVFALAACQSTVTHRQRIPFSQGAAELVVTSVGSALGEEKYELSYDNGTRKQVFFRGANFSEFHVGERDGKLVIQMCRGWIDHAEPILTGNAKDPQLERLNLDWNCLDKSHEA